MEESWRVEMEKVVVTCIQDSLNKDPRLPKLRESIADIDPKYRDDDDLVWRIMQCRDTVPECDKMLRDLAVRL
jgi:hypothetical protein